MLTNTRVVFYEGASADIAAQVAREDLSSVFIVSTKGRRTVTDSVMVALADSAVGRFEGSRRHVPATVIEAALAQARSASARSLLAIGGGSAIGVAKGMALRHREDTGESWPICAVPTTYSGSEVTNIWGYSVDGKKTTGRAEVVRPRLVVYDPVLYASFPRAATVVSCFNAMAHAVEAAYAHDREPAIDALAEIAIAELWRGVAQWPDGIEQRCRGAHLAGMCLGAVSMGLHHKLAHVLGGCLDLPHAATHTALLPYTAAFNLAAAPSATALCARAMGLVEANPGSAAESLKHRITQLDAATSLAELGVASHDLGRLARLATQHRYDNPREVDAGAVEQLLRAAHVGDLGAVEEIP